MKKIIKILIITITLLLVTGCDNETNESSMFVYSSVYPTEYILENLYGENLAIYSIYPDGTNYEQYKLTNKQLSDYSRTDLYVYNGTIPNEQDYAVKMINKNNNLKIIDATQGMTFSYDPAEAWLNPSNYLMMASNIKNGLKEYINEYNETKKINKNFEKIKLNLSQIDAELKLIASSASNKTIVVSDDAFKFLEKYGFNVISIEKKENLTDNELNNVKKLFSNKSVSYVFVRDGNEENEILSDLKTNYGAQVISLNSLSTLSAENRKDKKDYQSIMADNINSIKLEINN